MKRVLDILLSAFGLILLSPALAVVLLLVFLQDRRSPFYVAPRAGLGGQPFRMIKIRSMVVGAERTGVESTGAADSRITPLGHFVRRWKIDELSQLWNVLCGEMSLVGPRPNTMKEVASYTPVEQNLLSVRPGITDFSSIVFSDEGEIIKNAIDPDKAYHELIRPWKSRLGLIYIKNSNLTLDANLLILTIIAIFDKRSALEWVRRILINLGADAALLAVCERRAPLLPSPLP